MSWFYFHYEYLIAKWFDIDKCSRKEQHLAIASLYVNKSEAKWLCTVIHIPVKPLQRGIRQVTEWMLGVFSGLTAGQSDVLKSPIRIRNLYMDHDPGVALLIGYIPLLT